MADQAKELLEVPRDFLKDGKQFLNRCTKRMSLLPSAMETQIDTTAADTREFRQISQAVGVGFLVMGVIGYIVKLSECCDLLPVKPVLILKVHIPVNNILVGGA